ncbi:hypothetical protein PCL_06305 [Purpureocillium lilacinum]|uniref:Mitochondrial outer membrane protein OM14 C-terminal domain-containing protein n=1 Tax=Purpureocillium lilacinum TaxID=33203 RepID=A0A2U3EMA1_PURLI|nr:hypothetical protein PCL_06305 [Purpureocillium lilacinum]
MYNRRRHATAGLHLACREPGTCAGPRHRPPDSGGGVSHASSRRPHQPPSAQQEDATSRPSESKRQVQERGKILEEIESYHGRMCERVPRPARYRRGPVFPRLRWFLFARLGAKRVVFFCGGNMREQASNRPALGVPDVIPSMQRVHHRRKTAAAAAAAAATAQGAAWLVRWIAGRDQAGQQAPAVWLLARRRGSVSQPADVVSSVVRRRSRQWPQAVSLRAALPHSLPPSSSLQGSPLRSRAIAQAAAPAPPEIIANESASTSSLIDVDAPSVHTVPSDFLEQDVQTETQAARRDREDAAAEAKAKAEKARRDAAAKARRADNWLTAQFSKLSDGSAGALALANVAAVVGLSSYLGYRAWGLYEKGRLDWKTAGVGVGILAAVGALESVFGGYLYKGKKKGGSS